MPKAIDVDKQNPEPVGSLRMVNIQIVPPIGMDMVFMISIISVRPEFGPYLSGHPVKVEPQFQFWTYCSGKQSFLPWPSWWVFQLLIWFLLSPASGISNIFRECQTDFPSSFPRWIPSKVENIIQHIRHICLAECRQFTFAAISSIRLESSLNQPTSTSFRVIDLVSCFF